MAKGCACCWVMFFVFCFLGLAIQVWENYWPAIVGLSLSWASLRYLKAMRERDEG